MNQPEAHQIAAAVAIIRPKWLQSSLATTLARLPEHLRNRPARDVHLALLWLAYDPDQETPRLLREDGPWWNLAALAGPGTQPASTPDQDTHEPRCEHCGKTPAGCARLQTIVAPEHADPHEFTPERRRTSRTEYAR